jgi:hypothetical protein
MKARPYAKSLFGSALFVCALLLTGAPAHAQTVRGSFTLPCEATWGNAILPAGTYIYTVLSTRFPNVVRVQGNGKSVNVAATTWRREESPVKDKLSLVKTEDGHYAVRELSSRQLGLTLEYAVPKSSGTRAANKKARSASNSASS